MNPPWLAAFFALSAAAAWGSGDFTSGLASRRAGPFHTVLVSYSVGMVALALVALVRQEPFPPASDLLWGALAGISGMLGLGFLMRGFATGRMGIVAPISAVLAAAIPVLISILTEGMPGGLQLLGFAVALPGIWLLSRPEPGSGRPEGLAMALLAGVGFGVFFSALAQVGDGAVFWSLTASRLVAVALMLGFALASGRPLLPANLPLRLLSLAGLLDVGGNLLFLLATLSGRLDVAAVLASLYPAVTTLLARLVAGEHLARVQVVGVAAALLAIVLISV